jgi:hypothetical protein
MLLHMSTVLLFKPPMQSFFTETQLLLVTSVYLSNHTMELMKPDIQLNANACCGLASLFLITCKSASGDGKTRHA